MGAAGTTFRSVTARSGDDTRRRWTSFGAVVVVVLAAILALVGVDSAEVIATLLFALVFGATLLRGQVAGFVAAGLSTAVYAWLRRGALDDVGVAPFIVVVAGRAVSYVVVVKVGQIVSERMPPVPLPALPHLRAPALRRSAAAGAAYRDAGDVPVSPAPSPWGAGRQEQPEALVGAPAPPAAPATEEMGPWAEGQPLDDVLPTTWSALDDEETPWGPPREIERLAEVDDLATVDELPASAGQSPPDRAGVPWDWWADQAAGYDARQAVPSSAFEGPEGSSATWDAQPPPPHMPTGWMSDDPEGGETIPVGFTGELFIPDPSEPPPAESGPPPWSVEASPPQADHRAVETPWYEIGQPSGDSPSEAAVAPDAAPAGTPQEHAGLTGPPPDVDPQTGLQTAHYLRDRLSVERDARRPGGPGFSMVMVQIPDSPFQALPQTRQATLLRELGYQLDRAGMSDEIVHLPDGVRHWFAVVLGETDKTEAYVFEQRLRSAIAGYLRHRGLQLDEVQSASLTSPDDDETISAIWSSLVG